MGKAPRRPRFLPSYLFRRPTPLSWVDTQPFFRFDGTALVGVDCTVAPWVPEYGIVRIVIEACRSVVMVEHVASVCLIFSFPCVRTTDTVPPSATIGQYANADEIVVGAAPPPCSNPGPGGEVLFEIGANENPRTLQCRLSNWVDAYGDFDNAPERWSASTVQRWLADPKHLGGQIQRNLTDFQPAFAGIDGATLVQLDEAMLGAAPFSIEPAKSFSQARADVIKAIDAQKQPFSSCRSERSTPAVSKSYSTVELGQGLKLFELRAIDSADNVGSPAEYIWFVDITPPGVTFTLPPTRYTASGEVSAEWLGVESDAEGSVGIEFTDHTGIVQNCDRYSFRIELDGYDITPRTELWSRADRVGAAYFDDMDSRQTDLYHYPNYRGDQMPTAPGSWRDYTLAVIPTDSAGNRGSPVVAPFTVDKRAPITSITRAPAALSSQSAATVFDWMCDEDGATRNVSFLCTVDDGVPYNCKPGAILTLSANRSDSTASHTFTVLAIDEAGNAEERIRPHLAVEPHRSYNQYTWRVDTRPPSGRFVGSPAVPDPYPDQLVFTFRFQSDESGGRFDCILRVVHSDGHNSTRMVPYRTTSNSPLQGEAVFPDAVGYDIDDNGQYQFVVIPVDRAGNRGLAVVASWIIDTVAPSANVVQPAEHSAGHRSSADWAELRFLVPQTAGESPVTSVFFALDCLRTIVSCGVAGDRALFEQADGTMQSVCEPHFTPQLQNYTAGTNDIVAQFSGGDGEVHTVDCEDSVGTSMDPTFHPVSPDGVVLVGLHEGRHIVRVKAVDAAGNQGTETVYGWDADYQAPTATFQSGESSTPARLTNTPVATFRLEADESLATFECRLLCNNRDPARPLATMTPVEASRLLFHDCETTPFKPCGQLVTYRQLRDAIYKFQARAIDDVANVQSAVSTAGIAVPTSTDFIWEVDSTPAIVRFDRRPGFLTETNVSVTREPSVQFQFSANEPGVTFVCRRCIYAQGEMGTDEPFPGCSQFEACGTVALFWYNVWSPSIAESSSVLAAQRKPVPMCPAAVRQGCTPAEPHHDHRRRKCSRGFVAECGYRQYSHLSGRVPPRFESRSCATQVEFEATTSPSTHYVCIRREMLRHVLDVRSTDAVGNVGTIQSAEFIYDILPPVIQEIRSNSLEHPQTKALLSPLVPLRPFGDSHAVMEAGGNRATLDLYTEDTEISLFFDVRLTEAYDGNGPASFRCRVLSGGQELMAPATCASPFVLDNKTLPQSVLERSGATVRDDTGRVSLRDGTYTLVVEPSDAAGNRGETHAFNWVIDTGSSTVAFRPDYPNVPLWTSSHTSEFWFVCSEPGCTFECELAFVDAPGVGYRSASGLRPKVIEPFAPCGVHSAELELIIRPGVAGAHALVQFLKDPAVNLQAALEGMLESYAVADLSVAAEHTSSSTGRVLVTFEVLLKPSIAPNPTSLTRAFDKFLSGEILVADDYTGQSRFEFDDATGLLCDCSTCSGAAPATCNGPDGKFDCPCIARYTGAGRLAIEDFRFAALTPERRDLAALHPEAFAPGVSVEYRQYVFTVRPTDAVGVRGSSSTYIFHVDDLPPNTGLVGPASSPMGRAPTFTFLSDGVFHQNISGLVSTTVGGGVSFECRLRPLCWPYGAGQVATGQPQSAEEKCGSHLIETDRNGNEWDSCGGESGGTSIKTNYTALADGPYLFEVVAVDGAQNRDLTPAALEFFVEADVASVAIVAVDVRGSVAAVAFVGAVPGMNFTCAVRDATSQAIVAPAETCASPHSVGELADGTYVVEVIGTVADGFPSQISTAVFRIAVAATGLDSSESPGPVECNDDLPFVLAAVVIWLVVLGCWGALGFLFRRAALMDNPGGRLRTTRAFHNPAFGQDVLPSERPSVSAPSNFQHLQSGMDGLISEPQDFRHLAHYGRGRESPNFGLEQYGVRSDAKRIKRNQAKVRENPSFPGANKQHNRGARQSEPVRSFLFMSVPSRKNVEWLHVL